MAKKRAFVKYTKKGKIIPGSLIVTTNGGYPVDGLYKEVATDLCCNDSSCCDKVTVTAQLPELTVSPPFGSLEIIVGCGIPKGNVVYANDNGLSSTLQEAIDGFNTYMNGVATLSLNGNQLSATVCKQNCIEVADCARKWDFSKIVWSWGSSSYFIRM